MSHIRFLRKSDTKPFYRWFSVPAQLENTSHTHNLLHLLPLLLSVTFSHSTHQPHFALPFFHFSVETCPQRPSHWFLHLPSVLSLVHALIFYQHHPLGNIWIVLLHARRGRRDGRRTRSYSPSKSKHSCFAQAGQQEVSRSSKNQSTIEGKEPPLPLPCIFKALPWCRGGPGL